jgi:hypothetical protein
VNEQYTQQSIGPKSLKCLDRLAAFWQKPALFSALSHLCEARARPTFQLDRPAIMPPSDTDLQGLLQSILVLRVFFSFQLNF